MVTNDRIILDEVLKQGLSEADPGTTPSSFFEFFTAEQVLKEFDLSGAEIESGVVGDGGDGGIDAIYLLVNGELIQEDPDYSHLKRDITIDLVVVQSKTHAGFQETPIERFISVSNDLFDLSKDLLKLTGIYNERLLEVIQHLHDLWRQLANQFPTLNVAFLRLQGFRPERQSSPQSRITREHGQDLFPKFYVPVRILGCIQTAQPRAPTSAKGIQSTSSRNSDFFRESGRIRVLSRTPRLF